MPWVRPRDGVRENRWYSASIECVLPPPNCVCRFTTGLPDCPASRSTARRSSSFSPLVRNVRAKNWVGSVYSGASWAVPVATACRSAANSEEENLPVSTSLCGVTTSRHGLMVVPATVAVAATAVVRCRRTLRVCFSNTSR